MTGCFYLRNCATTEISALKAKTSQMALELLYYRLNKIYRNDQSKAIQSI